MLELAAALQRSLLPQLPSQLPGVEIAYRYLPSNDVIQVGGDWFDAIMLPGKRIGLVVGDVMGHGVASAMMMGQLRTAVQTLAVLGLPPHELLRHLDEAARRLSDTHLATCLYAVYDPVSRRCTLANAGHLPPVLARPGEPGRILDIPTGVPIGVGGHAFDAVEFDIDDGETLVLFTDGLVETSKRDFSDGLEILRAALPLPRVPLEDACDTVIEALDTAPRGDDAALLMARFRSIPAANVARWSLEPAPRAAGQARRLVRRALARWDLGHLSPVAELLVTELVGNSIRFASRPIGLRLLHTDTLTCEVHDDSHTLPVPRTPHELSENGRGLSIIGSLSHRWGTNRTDTGKIVWFELEPGLPAAERPPGQ
ncbi:SpoIIE family protein phosphatase [Streptacidiphilus sp. PB12-B1b]|uniref:ATP-binding SpoIIE family protein phosphatase n=1 Tax=Streptacidiphilus sp. PB12-B1b TaxID=2705012 RepID=UPI0015FCF0B1|nr:ATP-binding SpoIIE family protein phosphatase [Streptacidiphilus sp. PB12-B1b]QMU76590.1 SpoIIE family protein phosphatase [Streptacidiphilus sp. PB12-B1b]